MTSHKSSSLIAISLFTAVLTSTACSVLPEDIRASLPEAMRGDTQALKDYPTPQLSGRWQDTDYPELTITIKQNGTDFSMSREGDYKGIPVVETYQGTLEGRSAKLSYKALDKGQVRPVQGKCFGVASKDSSSLQLTCEDAKKGTVPLNLKKY